MKKLLEGDETKKNLKAGKTINAGNSSSQVAAQQLR